MQNIFTGQIAIGLLYIIRYAQMIMPKTIFLGDFGIFSSFLVWGFCGIDDLLRPFNPCMPCVLTWNIKAKIAC